VGFLDGLLGRKKPARPNLDALFAIPAAAVTLQVSMDFLSTGQGAVAFRSIEGRAFADIEAEVRALLDAYGYTWVVVTTDPPDVSSVVTDLHAVNATLADSGFGPQLLCSIVPFRDPRGVTLALIYLYKRGSFYPFVPGEGERRDSVMELQARDLLQGELPWEMDLSRWFPVWDAPGL
jgi:hypothetical protein